MDISDLIEQGGQFTYENFSSKSRHGYPNALSDDWIVWTHHVQNVLEQIGASSMAGKSIERGLNRQLLGNDQDDFVSALGSILSGLKAAKRIHWPDIPASDRVVSLGHYSPEQQQALEKLDQLVVALKETNDFPGEPEEKEQVVAELSAGRRLLEAARVRVAAVRETLAPALKWISEKAGGAVIGKLASDVWQYLTHLHIF
ncbi:hypothetical protein N2605_16205 [Bradyrhizobium yuanmingense]|uniref:hypothetical protein n=1 Tax=Bradyrhizobium yuanmingense TaxID=108015 RepID=UPI0021A5424F|nr:hypothetical protein [Bradyrhizobium sp. CB1024]UWU87919.1 hypothetical protein N2605_16205 [Bradyrhizobium sp. CB1024]